jgi:hypothetical protein
VNLRVRFALALGALAAAATITAGVTSYLCDSRSTQRRGRHRATRDRSRGEPRLRDSTAARRASTDSAM